MVVPSSSPTVTALNRSGWIAFFAIDNRILYSSDSDSVGGFPVSLYKVALGYLDWKRQRKICLPSSGDLQGWKKKLQIRFNSARRIRWLAAVWRPIHIMSCGKSLMYYNIMPFELFNIQRGISAQFSKCKIINNSIILYELKTMPINNITI